MKTNQRRAGVIISYISQIINMLSGVLYTPVMLRLLGQSEYGLYQLVYSVVSYLGLLSFGFSSSYMRFYSRFKVKNEEEEIARLNGMFMTIFLFISAICVCCGIVMVLNIEVIFGSGLTKYEYSKASILMILMILNLAITFPNSVFDSFTSSQEKFLFQKSLVALQYLFNPFLTLPLLIMGYGSIAMVTITTCLSLLKLFVNMWYCLKRLHIKILFKEFNFKLLKEMWVFTFFIFINLIVDQINWSVDKFLLGRIAGTTSVAIYGVGAQLNTMYTQLSTAVSSVFVPQVNKIVAESDDNNQLTKLFTKVGRIQFVILSLVLSTFIFIGHPFVKIWAGSGYDDSYSIALLLMIPVTIPLIQNIGIEIQRAKNMHKARSIVYILIAIVNIFISIPLIKVLGVKGAALGTGATMFIGNGIVMNWYYNKKIGLNILYFWKEILKFSQALIAPFIMGIVIVKYIKITNFLTLLLSGVAYIFVFSISFWLFGLNENEKKMIVLPLRKLLKR